jgi:hypothetical protein
MSKRKRGRKMLRKRLIEEAKHLLTHENVPISKVSKRLKLSIPLLKRIIDSNL